MLAARLPARLAVRLELERLLEEAAALLRVVRVGADAVEALQRELLRHLRMVGDQRLVRALAGDQGVPQALGVAEREGAVLVALAGDALVGQAALPEVDRLGRGDAPADGMHHPGAGLALPRARVLEEGDVVARRALLVAVEEVVDGRVVLVDALLDEAQAQDAGVEVEVARGVAGDRGDVVHAVELHAATLPNARGAPGWVDHAAHATDPHRLAAGGADHHQPRRVALAAHVEATREGDPRAVGRPARMLVVGLASGEAPEAAPVGADHVELAARRARGGRARAARSRRRRRRRRAACRRATRPPRARARARHRGRGRACRPRRPGRASPRSAGG